MLLETKQWQGYCFKGILYEKHNDYKLTIDKGYQKAINHDCAETQLT